MFIYVKDALRLLHAPGTCTVPCLGDPDGVEMCGYNLEKVSVYKLGVLTNLLINVFLNIYS